MTSDKSQDPIQPVEKPKEKKTGNTLGAKLPPETLDSRQRAHAIKVAKSLAGGK